MDGEKAKKNQQRVLSENESCDLYTELCLRSDVESLTHGPSNITSTQKEDGGKVHSKIVFNGYFVLTDTNNF